MQQQAAIMAASHGGYLTPSVAFPATQIHQMGALNINSLPPTPMTPVSGEFHQALGEHFIPFPLVCVCVYWGWQYYERGLLYTCVNVLLLVCVGFVWVCVSVHVSRELVGQLVVNVFRNICVRE